MPRQKSFNVETLAEILTAKKYDIFDQENNKFCGPTHVCWTDIAKILGNVTTSKHIYTIVTEDRYNIRSKSDLKYEVPSTASVTEGVESIIFENKQSDEEYEKSESDSFIGSSDESDTMMKFNLTLSDNEWKILFTNMKYRRIDRENMGSRYYNVLCPYEWTNKIYEHFYQSTRLPCSLSFKRNKIFTSGNIYLKFIAKCSNCKSRLTGIVDNPPEPESIVIIKCTYSGSFSLCKKGNLSKRRIIGEKRKIYTQFLTKENKSATFIRRCEAKDLIKYGDVEPNHVPSLNALRCMKYKSKVEARLDDNPVTALLILKGIAPFNMAIRSLSYDPFFIHFWTTTQLNNYRVYCKKNKIPTISIDATGGLVKKIKLLSNRETHVIFLYEIAVNDLRNSSQFGVAHMLSEKHDNNTISYWLSEWVRSDVTMPKVVVTDDSLALMMAAVKAFTQYSTLHKYLDICSSLLNNKGGDVPKCMIRIDFNHIMHLLSTWPEIKSSTRRIKNFYMRSFGLLICTTNITDIKLLLKYIFTVGLHEEDGTNSEGNPTACEEAKIYLKERIGTHVVQDLETILENENLDVDDPDFNNGILDMKGHSIYDDLKKIYIDCEKDSHDDSNKGSHENLQHNPALSSRLLQFCKLLPCWSAVMTPIFGYGKPTETSASSESLFNDLKNRVLQHKTLPLRADEFLELHVHATLGNMNLIKAHYETGKEKLEGEKIIATNKRNEDLGKSNNSVNINENYAIENWRGQGEEIVLKKKRKNYLDPDPTINLYNENNRGACSVIGTLRNGNVSDLRSVKIKDNFYTFLNTCPFDCIFQILCVAYVDSKQYCEFVDRREGNVLLFEMVAHAIRDGITVQAYRKRAFILNEIFLEKKAEKVPSYFSVNTATTAHHMITKLFSLYPSVTENRHCSQCKKKTYFQLPSININLPTENFTFLQDASLQYLQEPRKCTHCGEVTETQILIHEHIFIEVCAPFKKKEPIDLITPLHEIPQLLNLDGKNFMLRGVISFLAPQSKSSEAVGHFVAYCWREHEKRWERYDDLQNSSKIVRSSTIINIQFLMLST